MHMSEATPFACISVSDVCMPQRSQKEFQQVHDQLVIGRHCAAKDVLSLQEHAKGHPGYGLPHPCLDRTQRELSNRHCHGRVGALKFLLYLILSKDT